MSLSSLTSLNLVKYANGAVLPFVLCADITIFPNGYIDFISRWVYYLFNISIRIYAQQPGSVHPLVNLPSHCCTAGSNPACCTAGTLFMFCPFNWGLGPSLFPGSLRNHPFCVIQVPLAASWIQLVPGVISYYTCGDI